MPLSDTYLVGAANLDVTAEVTGAPSTRHARTAFLDYLTRNHLIPYTQRKTVRSVLYTKRILPGQIATSVQLDYSTGNPIPTSTLEVPQPTPTMQAESVPEQSMQPEPQPVQEQSGTGFENSPVFKMSKGFGR